jgi:hypothetical protein
LPLDNCWRKFNILQNNNKKSFVCFWKFIDLQVVHSLIQENPKNSNYSWKMVEKRNEQISK